jgi:hypothetical protein
MPEEITLTLGCFETDRVRPILDGRIRIPGVRFQREPGEPQDLFRRALRLGPCLRLLRSHRRSLC